MCTLDISIRDIGTDISETPRMKLGFSKGKVKNHLARGLINAIATALILLVYDRLPGSRV